MGLLVRADEVEIGWTIAFPFLVHVEVKSILRQGKSVVLGWDQPSGVEGVAYSMQRIFHARDPIRLVRMCSCQNAQPTKASR